MGFFKPHPFQEVLRVQAEFEEGYKLFKEALYNQVLNGSVGVIAYNIICLKVRSDIDTIIQKLYSIYNKQSLGIYNTEEQFNAEVEQNLQALRNVFRIDN
jgi:hypothetical protein